MNKSYIYGLIAIVILGAIYFAYSAGYLGKKVTIQNPVVSTIGTSTTVTLVSLTKNSGLASVLFSDAKTIAWKTENYPANAGININLIKKVSDSPAQFALVRAIAKDSPNDGTETWTPQRGEYSNDIYVEVTCSDTYQFKTGCKLGGEPIKVN